MPTRGSSVCEPERHSAGLERRSSLTPALQTAWDHRGASTPAASSLVCLWAGGGAGTSQSPSGCFTHRKRGREKRAELAPAPIHPAGLKEAKRHIVPQ